MKIFLSAGHTPTRPGAVASYAVLGDVAGDLVEHDLNREFVFGLAGHLRLIRPCIVPIVPLRDRIRYVNRWSEPGDYALEIHHNAASTPEVKGVEAFCLRNSRHGNVLAERTTMAITAIGRQHRGVRAPEESQHSSLGWLRNTKPWAALLEVEFITNEESAIWLVGGGLRRAARAVAQAIDQLA